jgi:hypothetical protein
MWFFPTRGRAHLAQRLFDAGRFTTRGAMLLDEDDAMSYTGVAMPGGWQSVVLPRMSSSARLNEAFRLFPDEPWYGVVSDDVLPMTEGWDAELVRRAGSAWVAWANDNFKRRAVTVVLAGHLVRRLGWVCCPAVKHFYGDDAWELIAEHVGGGLQDDIVVSHEHWQTGRMPKDQTYLDRPKSADDRAAYAQWLAVEWPAVRERLQPEMATC